MKIGVIGEGETEYYCVPTLVAKCGHIVAGVHHLGGIGSDFPWDKLFLRRVYPYVRAFALKQEQNRPDRVIVVFDRETREECCGILAAHGQTLLAQELAKEDLEVPVSVVLANRQVECWLLANITALDSSPIMRRPISGYLGQSIDETNVLGIIKRNLKPGCGWNKPRYGKALAQRLDLQDQTNLSRSRSLRKLVKELG